MSSSSRSRRSRSPHRKNSDTGSESSQPNKSKNSTTVPRNIYDELLAISYLKTVHGGSPPTSIHTVVNDLGYIPVLDAVRLGFVKDEKSTRIAEHLPAAYRILSLDIGVHGYGNELPVIVPKNQNLNETQIPRHLSILYRSNRSMETVFEGENAYYVRARDQRGR